MSSERSSKNMKDSRYLETEERKKPNSYKEKYGEYKNISGFMNNEPWEKIYIIVIAPVSIFLTLFLIYSQDLFDIEITGRIKIFWWFVAISLLLTAVYLGLQLISQNVKDGRRGKYINEIAKFTYRDDQAIFSDNPNAAVNIYGKVNFQGESDKKIERKSKASDESEREKPENEEDQESGSENNTST